MSWVGMTMVAVALLACGAVMPKLPSEGGPAWRELRSANVTLWTNASSKRGFELIQEMEQRRQIIARAMNQVERSGRIFAVAVRSRRELLSFVPKESAAIAWSTRNPSGQPGILLAADELALEEADILNHELAHAVSFSLIPRQPAWLAEGLASYFEKASPDEDNEVQIGIPERHVLVEVRQSPLMPAAKLFACESDCRTLQLYSTGWALLSYLINEHFDRLGKYLQRLNELPYEQHLRAWQEVFPDLTAEKIDRELPGWVYAGAFKVPRFKVHVKLAPATERLLGDADVLAVRSLLYWIRGKKEPSVAAASAALALDRKHLLANEVGLALALPRSLQDLRDVVAAAPDDWRAWTLLAKALEPGAERYAAQDRACALAGRENLRCERVLADAAGR